MARISQTLRLIKIISFKVLPFTKTHFCNLYTHPQMALIENTWTKVNKAGHEIQTTTFSEARNDSLVCNNVTLVRGSVGVYKMDP